MKRAFPPTSASEEAEAAPSLGLLDLPPEILEIALAQLSLSDLLLNVAPTCSRLRDVANSPGFVPWKKSYCQYKRTGATVEGSKARSLLEALSASPDSPEPFDDGVSAQECVEDAKALELFLPCLVTEARKPFWKGDRRLFASVTRHRMHPMVKAWAEERMPCLLLCGGDPDPVSACVAICMFAKDVWDIMELIHVLLRMSPPIDDKTKTYSSIEVRI